MTIGEQKMTNEPRWRCEIKDPNDFRSQAKFIRAKNAHEASEKIKKLFGQQVYIQSILNDGKN